MEALFLLILSCSHGKEAAVICLVFAVGFSGFAISGEILTARQNMQQPVNTMQTALLIWALLCQKLFLMLVF